MQKINIDAIVNELRKSKEWSEYEEKLKNNLEVFGKDFTINQLLSINGILDSKNNIFNLIDNKEEEKKIDKNNFWKWINREKNFPEFKKLELKFLDLFLENIKFCPYCGKIPLIRYENDKNEKKGTFHLDHIFPKSNYRYLTYNFYNLIPVCSICNQLKGTKNLFKIKEKVYHPYFGWLIKNGKKLKLNENNFDDNIKFEDKFSNKIFSSKHFKFFNLDKIYLNSKDTENDIWFIRKSREKILASKSNGKEKWSDIKLKNYFFKHYAPEKEQDILKFSNGKLKKDLIENLKI